MLSEETGFTLNRLMQAAYLFGRCTRANALESTRTRRGKQPGTNRTHDFRVADDEEDEIPLRWNGVADGTRTHDNRNHNPGLYQLSYSHH